MSVLTQPNIAAKPGNSLAHVDPSPTCACCGKPIDPRGAYYDLGANGKTHIQCNRGLESDWISIPGGTGEHCTRFGRIF